MKDRPADSQRLRVGWLQSLARRFGANRASSASTPEGLPASGVMGEEEVRRVGQRAQLQAGQESVQNTTAMVSFSHGLFGSNPFTVPLAALLQLLPTFVAHAGSEFTSNRKQVRRQVALKSFKSLFQNTGPTLGTYAITGGSLPAAAAASLTTMGYLGVKAAKAEAEDEGRFATRREKFKEALQQALFGSSSIVLGGASGQTLNWLVNSRFFDKANEVVRNFSLDNPVTLAAASTVGAGYTSYRVLKARAAKRQELAQASAPKLDDPPSAVAVTDPQPPSANTTSGRTRGTHQRKRRLSLRLPRRGGRSS